MSIAGEQETFGNVRLLVTSKEPSIADDDSRVQTWSKEWFREFEGQFRQAAVDKGFKVVTDGAHDLQVTLEATDVCVKDDAVEVKMRVRAIVNTGGKSKQLLADVAYQTGKDVKILRGAVAKKGSHAHYARMLLKRVTEANPVFAFAKNGGGTATEMDDEQRIASESKTTPASKHSFRKGNRQNNGFALIIGIERYRDVKTAASGARADAKTFAKVAATTLGIPKKNMRIAMGARATKVDIEKHVSWLVKNVPTGGRVYVYFSGHGAPDASSGTPYLLPYDGDPSALPETAVALRAMLDKLNSSKAKETIAFVDSCFSGSGGRSVLPKGARPLVRVKKTAKVARVALFSAVSGAQISGPSADGKHGIFSQFVADGLGSGKADANGDGDITLEELSAWVTPRVEREARRQDREQRPDLTTPQNVGTDEFVIASGMPTE